jgi:beta-catenin-like protein 1
LLELLVQNFGRFNEEEESDRQGLFHVLGIFENMLALNPELSGLIVTKTSFLQWLLSRIQAKVHDENRGYSAELLAILLQNSRENRIAFASQSGMEVTLQVLSVSKYTLVLMLHSHPFQQYRKLDPQTADEEEFMENTFDAICSALQEPENKDLFNESEGVDLMLIMMRYVVKESRYQKQCSRVYVKGKVDGKKQGHQSVRQCALGLGGI